ncbi:BTAD domain-containing putative transcriptional regulator [Kribbella sp. NPDC056345]|uniref:AfsR/SARP family transcriptional regulator n=1 Tax=Kribbella sp. NPDC056345 TaxID=3345789 RepID=UPI0035D8A21E
MSRAQIAKDLDCRVLGPLQLRVGQQKLKVPAGKNGVLLAILVVRVGELVSTEEVIDRLWGDDLPQRPKSALQTRITRVRYALDRGRPGLGQVIRSESGGYELAIDPAQVDLVRFRRLAQQQPTGCPLEESERLRQALDLVHGQILCDVRGPALESDIIPGLEEELLLARERRCELEISLGRHRELVSELRGLVGRHTFRERFWLQLMTCLYRSDRQTEALEAYCEIDRRLRQEVGVDPCEELRTLHARILRNTAVQVA